MLSLLLGVAALQQPLRVLGIQPELFAGNTEANLARAAELIRANRGFRLYVLPELKGNGYSDEVLSQLSTHAQEAETGSITAFFQGVAREVDAHICYGFLRCSGSGGGDDGRRYSICQGVVNPSGEFVLAYEKLHLCDMGDCSEMGYGCSPGSELGVFECDGLRVGVTVCYDLRFPELYRSLAWGEGCDLILHPAAFVRDATFHCYHQFAMTRAVENGVYLLSVNYAGASFGDSIAVGPWIGPVPELAEELSPSSLGVQEGVLPLTVEPSHLEAVRRAYPYRRNLNPALARHEGTGDKSEIGVDDLLDEHMT